MTTTLDDAFERLRQLPFPKFAESDELADWQADLSELDGHIAGMATTILGGGEMSERTYRGASVIELIHTATLVHDDVVDEADKILFVKNIDSLKQNDSLYLRQELEEMKMQNPPIINHLTDDLQQYVYYKDSILLTQLFYYPYIQLAIILIFILIAYYAFNSTKKAEQDHVWLGMSKETAHQLGTPITSLMAWVELLKEERNSDPTVIEEIQKDISRLEMIADRFSKIGSNPKLQEINISEQIQKSVDYIKLRVSDKITFVSNLEQYRDFIFFINPPLFDWVIENIFKNAVDAMDGKGQIKIDLIDANQFIYIDISDTGKGIPKNKQKTIFNPGFTTKKRGWGLGLSLAKRIIEEYHKGKIFVKKSELNKGTTIRIAIKKTFA
jgi:nitrogen fixation/metabolism regulation signal transduction histidine kinase